MLTSGNFAYAVTHLDCIVDDGFAHHKCEMECCQESDCCGQEEQQAYSGESITEDGSCCEVHIEQAIEQDFAILQAANTSENIKTDILAVNSNSVTEYKSEYIRVITHRFKTTNIYLSVSNLRI